MSLKLAPHPLDIFTYVQDLENITEDLCYSGALSDDWLIKNTILDGNVNIGVNSTFGGQRTVATWDANNTVAGGPALDLRPGEALFLPDFILMQQTMRLLTNESAFGSTLRWELNNDTGSLLRIFAFSTSDVGTFGSFAFTLGTPASDNQLTAAGDMDLTWLQSGLDRAINFDVNDGGSTLRMLRIDANDSVIGQPKTSFEGYTEFANSGVNYVSGQGVLEVTPLIDDIPGGGPVAIGANISPIFEYTGGIAGFGSGLRALSVAPTFRPASGLGAGTDSTPMTGALVASIWDGNGTGRTAANVQGFTLQAAVRGGTVTSLIGMQSQAGTVLGGSSATTAISVRANAPFEFLGGIIGEGISFVSQGGTFANTNWNAQFRNALVPSYFAGDLAVGHTGTPSARLHLIGSSIFNGSLSHTGASLGFYGATPVAQSTGWSTSNVTTTKVVDADNMTLNGLSDVVASIIDYLLIRGDFVA